MRLANRVVETDNNESISRIGGELLKEEISLDVHLSSDESSIFCQRRATSERMAWPCVTSST